MSEQGRRKRVGATRRAWDTLAQRPGACFCLFAANTALRAAAYAPLYLAVTQKREDLPVAYYLAASLALCLLLVLPARIFSHAVARRLIAGTRYSPVIDDDGRETGLRSFRAALETGGALPDYGRCLRFSLIRYGIGLLWGLPCAALTTAWCYGFLVLKFNEFMPILLKISRFFGGEYYDLGTAVWMIAIALTGGLFFCGWRRGMTRDFTRLVGRTDRHALKVAAEVRGANKKRLARHTLSQIPYLLPSVIACAAVLYGYVRAAVEWSPSLTNNAVRLMTLLRAPLPDRTVALLLLILLFVHAPLAFFRKMRSAALMQTLFAERAERRNEARHAA